MAKYQQHPHPYIIFLPAFGSACPPARVEPDHAAMPTKANGEKEQSEPEVIVLDDDDDLPQCLSTAAPRIKPPKPRRPKSCRARSTSNVTIDLTASIDNLFGKKEESRQKKADAAGDELRLMCPICMSNMKEETSTSCGHLFCKECIHTSLRHRKECPTCRKKLTINHVHRIYLSSSTI